MKTDREKIAAVLGEIAVYFRSSLDAMDGGTLACEAFRRYAEAAESALALLKEQEPAEADLISRAAAIAEVEQWAEHGYDVIHWTGIKAMLEVLPAVDAAPVHGRWTYFNCVGLGRYQCSECLHWVDAGADKNYCPNCGARMNGERKEADDGNA